MLQSIPTQSLMQVDLLQSIPRKVGHHASLLLRLPSAKECGGPFHNKCLQNSYAKCEAGQDAVYTWDWGDSRKGSWKPDDEETSINRYMIDFVRKQQKNIDNGRMRTIRLIWILEEDATPQWTGQILR